MGTTVKAMVSNPFRLALALAGALSRPASAGAQPVWMQRMTLMVVLLVPLVVLLHAWDADISRQVQAGTGFFMDSVRFATDFARTAYWFAAALLIWLLSALFLYPASPVRNSPWLLKANWWATLVLLSIVGAGIPLKLIKIAVGRARPYLLESLGPRAFDPFNGADLYQSFPSGHSMMAGILMVSLWIFFPFLRVVTVMICLLLVFSRMAIGAHYPSDVVAGFATGLIMTCCVARYMAARNIIFSTTDGCMLPDV